MKKEVLIIWQNGCPGGVIVVKNGSISKMDMADGMCSIENSSFGFTSEGECRLYLEVENVSVEPGAATTIVHVRTGRNPFSFFLRDACAEYPIYIPEYSVLVTSAGDLRSYNEIRDVIESRAAHSKLETIEIQPEESFDNAAGRTRHLYAPIWLGLSRDIRIFEAGSRAITYGQSEPERWDWVRPKYHGYEVMLPELGDVPVKYNYFAGRGLGCEQEMERWLEEGCLPIYNARYVEDDICYETKIFVTLEKSPLKIENIHGTHYLAADAYSRGSMLTGEQEKTKDAILQKEIEQEEETVAYIKINAVNMAKAPGYCWVRIPQPDVDHESGMPAVEPAYNGYNGFGSFGTDRVYLVATLNGRPVPQKEMAVLLKPGEKATYVFKIPHVPVTEKRAKVLANEDFEKRLSECTAYWNRKLACAAKFNIPEKRINDMMKAGILHLDLICYGNEPDGAVAPTIGHYSSIGSESSPIIQYLESVGKNDLARRSIMYFFEKQHEDGFMQNFGGYMLETGAVLWNMGEHYRYTQDKEWIYSIKGCILKACDYLIAWRNRNKKEELHGKGYGMIEGKVADPEDPYHSYMLNGYTYLGLKRSSEVLKAIGAEEALQIEGEANALLADIRKALADSIADCPVIPLGNGNWCPSVSPWVESLGPVCLYADEGECYTHGTVTTRDALCGSMYLFLQEVVDPNEVYGDFILRSYTELFYLRNTAFSQPYYSPHPYANLKRGEVKAFLKEFYNGVSGLADRETYTFWEHYHHVSSHKTHEEGWFLMRCRWMLYIEEGETIKLLQGVPRAWLEDGKKISIQGMKTYFGSLSLEVESAVKNGKVKVSVKIDAPASRLPRKVVIRIPHPLMQKALETTIGVYEHCTESVIIDGFCGAADIEINY